MAAFHGNATQMRVTLEGKSAGGVSFGTVTLVQNRVLNDGTTLPNYQPINLPPGLDNGEHLGVYGNDPGPFASIGTVFDDIARLVKIAEAVGSDEARRDVAISGLVELATYLSQHGVELLSTGGTAKALRDAQLPVVDVAARRLEVAPPEGLLDLTDEGPGSVDGDGDGDGAAVPDGG